MKKTYRVEGIDCANCALKIENKIKDLAGVKNVSLNFITQKLTFEAENEDIEKQVIKLVEKEEPDCDIEEI